MIHPHRLRLRVFIIYNSVYRIDTSFDGSYNGPLLKRRRHVCYIEEAEKFKTQTDAWIPQANVNRVRKARCSKAKTKRKAPVDRVTAPREGWKTRSISESSEIREILSQGREVRTPWCRLVFRKTSRKTGRFAVITSKRVGSAVQRNRIRRKVREILRTDRKLSTCGADLIVIPKAIVIKEEYADLKQKIHSVLTEICQ